MIAQPTTFIVDSFTDQPFKGNPAGVCLSQKSIAACRMQSIASELGLSETAFVVQARASGAYPIRFFSPKMEIPLCGHATLAAAKVIFEEEKNETITFRTVKQLELESRLVGQWIELQFPTYDLKPAGAPAALLAALGINRVEFCGYNEETRILMLEISSTRELAELRPDFRALLESHDSVHGVSVTARAHDGFDFHSRYFWPWSGTNEDPVTGGTHTFLAKYWGKRLGKASMRSFQASARTGQLEVELVGADRLRLRGQAVIVFAGNLKV